MRRLSAGVPKVILMAVISGGLIFASLVASQGATNLLSRLEHDSGRAMQPRGIARPAGPSGSEFGVHPIGAIARTLVPESNRGSAPIGAPARHLGDPGPGVASSTHEDSHDVEDGDRDDVGGHHHHHHHHHHP